MNYYNSPYNNSYNNPDYYSQMQQQLQQQQAQLQQMQHQYQRTIIDFIQGEAAGDVYPVNNGQKVILFDIDNPYLYQKERDTNGVLTKKKFRLIEEKEPEPVKTEPIDLTKYVKVEDVDQMIADAVDKKMAEYTLKPTKKKAVVEEE